MKVVLDTNVVVSGMMQAIGPSGRLLMLVASGELTPCYDERVLAEYDEVLRRPKLKIAPDRVDALLAEIRADGEAVNSLPITHAVVPDPDDLAFLEVAIAGGVNYLVTGNARHFPTELHGDVRVVGPREMLRILGRD